MSSVISNFYAWFFEKGDARVAAALRIAHGLLFIYYLVDLYPSMDLTIGHAGLYGTLDPEAFDPYHPLGLLYVYDSPFHLHIWFWISIVVAACTVLGFRTRVSIVLMFYSLLLLHTRGPHILYGTDQVFRQSLFIMLFLASDRRWSLDQLFRRRHHKEKTTEIELWPVKVIQIHIALVYLIAAFSKITAEPWVNGSAVYYALSWHPFAWQGAPFFTQNKLLMVFMNYYTILAELAFPFLVFRSRGRWIAIGGVLLMHFGIDILMNIKFFALSMYIGYLSFIKPSEWKWLVDRLSPRQSSKELFHSRDTYPSSYEEGITDNV